MTITEKRLVSIERSRKSGFKRRTVRNRVHQKLASDVHLLTLVLREVLDGEAEGEEEGHVEDETNDSWMNKSNLVI